MQQLGSSASEVAEPEKLCRGSELEAQRRGNDLSFSLEARRRGNDYLRLPVEDVATLRNPYGGVWRPLSEVSASAALAAHATARGSIFFTELHDLDSVKTFTLNVGALYGIGNAWGKLSRWKCFFSADKHCEIGRVMTDVDVQTQATLLLMVCLHGGRHDLVETLAVKTVAIMLLTSGVKLLAVLLPP